MILFGMSPSERSKARCSIKLVNCYINSLLQKADNSSTQMTYLPNGYILEKSLTDKDGILSDYEYIKLFDGNHNIKSSMTFRQVRSNNNPTNKIKFPNPVASVSHLLKFGERQLVRAMIYDEDFPISPCEIHVRYDGRPFNIYLHECIIKEDSLKIFRRFSMIDCGKETDKVYSCWWTPSIAHNWWVSSKNEYYMSVKDKTELIGSIICERLKKVLNKKETPTKANSENKEIIR